MKLLCAGARNGMKPTCGNARNFAVGMKLGGGEHTRRQPLWPAGQFGQRPTVGGSELVLAGTTSCGRMAPARGHDHGRCHPEVSARRTGTGHGISLQEPWSKKSHIGQAAGDDSWVSQYGWDDTEHCPLKVDSRHSSKMKPPPVSWHPIGGRREERSVLVVISALHLYHHADLPLTLF